MRDRCGTGDELCKAAAFVLTNGNGTIVGLGLICFDCHYAGVRWPGAEGIDRRLGTQETWSAIERELKAGLPTTLLSPLTACAQILVGRADVRVQWVGWAKRLEADDPSESPVVLDALLFEAADLIAW